MSRFVGETGPSEVKGIRSDSEFSRIEKLIKENTFSREEISNLLEILNSRAEIEPDKNKPIPGAGADGEHLPLIHDFPRTPTADRTMVGTSLEKREVPRGVGPSPIDIARAFMAGRTSEQSQDLNNFTSNSERLQMSNEFARKPLVQSPSPKPSICWPGAMVQDSHGYTSPQSQRGRYGVRDFPRTPYSRTSLSKSTTRLQDDTRLTNTSTPFQQSQTSIFGQVSSRAEAVDGYGSVGPIRRIRSRFASEVRPRGSIFLNSPKDVPSKMAKPNIFGGFLHSTEKNLEPGETSGASKNWSVDNVSGSPVGGSRDPNSTASQAVKKILEHLDRNKPTPKEKEAELKLGTSWRNPSASGAGDTVREENINAQLLSSRKSTGVGSLNYPADITKSSGTPNRSVKFHDGRVNDADTDNAKASSSMFANSSRIPGATIVQPFGLRGNPDPVVDNDNAKASSSMFANSSRIPGGTVQPFGLKGNSEPVVKNLHENSLRGTNHGQKVTSFGFQPSNGHDFKSLATPTGSDPSKNSPRTKPSLPSISINKQYPRPVSSDNGPGFTFPFSSSSGVLSELPTPSIMPSSSTSIQSQPQSMAAVPSYTFGANNSTPRLVFSFPSTSNSSTTPETSDLKFTFGSDDKTNRLSFSTFGKDSVCY
ncbi:hypothetical protein ACJIZ3_021128 [Penstemon smallii]|uniref:Uncharacterized protein n=1 Tax=Penstemon smallii TaxID=265156 RepID=A0ABD3SKL0_9LAMI